MKERAAIYCRYSSHNQRDQSIEDQIANCRRFAARMGLSIQERHIYIDKAISGSRHDRKGLAAMMEAAEAGEFDILLVDDLSRLSRENLHMLSTLAQLQYSDIRTISVADGLDSDDEESSIVVQFRGIINEIYSKDLTKKTRRGQEGQKARGYFVGEKTYGYESVGKGTQTIDRHGNPRHEGYDMTIEPKTAAIVLRVFNMYADGASKTSIVKTLNAENVPGTYRWKGGWGPSTISRMLENEKYIGRWIWNRTKAVKDPKTGKKKQKPRPESEWIVFEREDLRIVPQELWDRVRERARQVRKNYESEPGQRGFTKKQKGSAKDYPKSLLAGSMVCALCNSAISLVSGRHGGYFGCSRAAKKGCDNNVLVRKAVAERILLESIHALISDAKRIKEIIRVVQDEVRKLRRARPEELSDKERELEREQRRLNNFIEFVAQGRASGSLGKAIEKAELTVNRLEDEIEALKSTLVHDIRPVPRAWIEDRLSNFRSILAGDIRNAALAIRTVLGEVRLTPIRPDIGRAYYRADTRLGVLDLLDVPDGGPRGPDSESGDGNAECPDRLNASNQGTSHAGSISFLQRGRRGSNSRLWDENPTS